MSRSRSTPRRSHWPRWIVVLLLLLAVVVAVDRIALAVAERAAARTIQNSQHLDRTPSVSIAGFPFLTQLATGHFGKVTLTASDLTVGGNGRTVRIASVRADLHGVHVARDLSSVRADSATADATFTYADLSSTIGVALGYGGPSADGVGRVTARSSVAVAGRRLSGSVTTEVEITGGALRFVSPQVTVDGLGGAAVPQSALDALRGVYGAPIALLNLPFGLSVRSVTAGPHGVRITLVGADLRFQRS